MPRRRVGIVGGTFDPPHLGHLVLGAAAYGALALDAVIFVPAGDPWRKRGQVSASATDRLAMVRAAVAHLDWATVDDREVHRSGPTYTVETLDALHAEQPETEWWLIGGADLLTDLPHWHEPARLLGRCRLAIAGRGSEATPPAAAAQALAGMSAAEVAAHVDAVPMPGLRVSSTDLRARYGASGASAASGAPAGGDAGDEAALAVLLPTAVRTVIRERGLYRAQSQSQS